MMAIEAEDLKKRFGDVEALKGVSFKVKRGEIFGFLGPNGAGKTTTVRILTGIIKPDFGKARVNGYDVVEETLKAKESIGVLPEVSNAYPDLTAWQNIMLIASLYGMRKRDAEARANELLKEFGIYERKDAKVRGFSKGMKQRLMLCMALISDPEILFLDEPTSGLDVQSARMIREKILEIANERKTVFLTSHNMDEVNMMCDRIAIINRGKIVTIDTPERLKSRVGGSVAIEVSFGGKVELNIENAEKVGDKYVIYTTDPYKTICEVVDFARKSSAEIVSINTRTPTLEDAFLKLLEAEG
ncbi:MAG: ATP-binding cassette domain-containing protein [Archaeoglobus sp.]|uniref:ABC transporter ATP-binding protein n=1 Tax=Archaeoglobus sp. TaxID=1872626 RepID=UPI001D4A7284|nr:ATP-binding cassette domain-containing protein [Archaeoglobus sp.]MBO8179891.1 ATP-binding cassette domain-containing protein [Archaeoglobus sp.]